MTTNESVEAPVSGLLRARVTSAYDVFGNAADTGAVKVLLTATR